MRTWRAYLVSGALLATLAAAGTHLLAQRQGAVPAFTDADWPRYAGDFAGAKYSKLTQINTTNVATLVPAWTFQGVGTQQTPIGVNGVLYASTPNGVVALDGASGAVVWRYGAAAAASGGAGAGRGGGRGGGRGAGGAGAGGGRGAGRGAAGAPQTDAAAAAGEGQDGAAAAAAPAGRAGGAAGGAAPGGRGGAVPTA